MDADDDSSSSLETVANVDDDNNQTNHRQTISSYISPYSGRTRISRLLFIAGDCSSDDTSMKLEALRLAFDEIKKGEDTFLMEKTVNQIHGRLGSDYTRDDAWFDAVKKKADQKEKDLESDLTFYMTLRSEFNEIKNKDTFLAKALLMMEVINKVNERSGSGYALHKAWLDAIEKNTELEEEKYISDLDIYKTLIEECVRKVYHDFGDFYYACGRLGDAMKNYMKTRDYCTTSKQKIHLRLIAIMISIELRQFQRINTHVTRAKEVMESLDTSEFTAFDTSLTKVKLCCADGLAYLFYQKYKEAADKFIEANSEANSELGSQYNEVITSRDVALYGGLCALASFDSKELKKKVVENTVFWNFLELVPDVRMLIDEYFKVHFESPVAVESRLAEYLGNLKSNLLLDIHMRSHVDALYELITQQAVLYRIELAPFDVKAQIASKLMKEGAGTYEELCSCFKDLSIFYAVLRRVYTTAHVVYKPEIRTNSLLKKIKSRVQQVHTLMNHFGLDLALILDDCVDIAQKTQHYRILAELCEHAGHLNGLKVIRGAHQTSYHLGAIYVVLGPNGTTYSCDGKIIPSLASTKI